MQKHKRFSLLVFDWDGTLMDSEARIVSCMQAAISDVGLSPLEHGVIRDIIGLGLSEAMNRLFPESDQPLRQSLTARYRHHFLGNEHSPSTLFPGAMDTLLDLHGQGYLLAVATGKGRAGLESVLVETGCKRLFHATRCADETSSKPDPQMLHEIMADLGIPTTQTLMIGDTEYDMHMAHNAGAAAIAVSCGVHERARLLQCDPLACLDSIAGLCGWLAST
jgi:phosphoglycolate phosphatase